MRDLGFQPEGCKLLVKVEKVSEKTEGGIYVPDSVQDAAKFTAVRGEVLAIGPAAAIEFDDGPLKVGDEVIHAKHSGVFVTGDDGVDVRIVNDIDIQARIR